MTVSGEVENQLRAALPHVSPQARVILDALRFGGGRIWSAAEMARLLGIPSRFTLGRMLRRQGLPGLRELASWINVLGWVIVAERSKASLFLIATRSRRIPAVCYRTVKRLTGLTWVELKARGSPWALRLFIDRCQAIRRQRKNERGRNPASCGQTSRRSSVNHLVGAVTGHPTQRHRLGRRATLGNESAPAGQPAAASRKWKSRAEPNTA